MQHDIQVLDRVKSAYATLRPSEQRVAPVNIPELIRRILFFVE